MNFNIVASSYERGRPGYPKTMFSDLENWGALPGPAATRLPAILEIGSGSGQATAQLLPYGESIDCIEPGHKLSGLLREKYSGDQRVNVHACDFEEYELERKYSLVFAASSLHWIDPDVAFGKSHEALCTGGWLVAVWNTPLLPGAVYEICEQVITGIDPEFSIPKPSDDVVAFFQEGYSDFSRNRGFTSCRENKYRIQHRLTPERMADLLWSYAGASRADKEGARLVANVLIERLASLKAEDLQVDYTYMMACGKSS